LSKKTAYEDIEISKVMLYDIMAQFTHDCL